MKKSYKSEKKRGKSDFKGSKSFGAKKFGNKGRFGRSDNRHQDLHDCTCSTCGRDCQVPFKPSGRKPVLCSACFKRDDDGTVKRFGGSSYKEKRFSDKFGGRPSVDTGKIEKRLISIENKLDVLLEALTEEVEE